jgi:hypothetical protein
MMSRMVPLVPCARTRAAKKIKDMPALVAHLLLILFAQTLLALPTNCENHLLLTIAEPIPMLEEFQGEARGKLLGKLTGSSSMTSGVIYLSEAKRAQFESLLEDGKLVNTKGEVLTIDGSADYILSPDGRLIVRPNNERYLPAPSRRHFHSSLSAGKPVQMAGEIRVKDGIILSINNSSGHYRPTAARFWAFLEGLRELGVDLSQTQTMGLTNSIDLSSISAADLRAEVQSSGTKFNFSLDYLEARRLGRISGSPY